MINLFTDLRIDNIFVVTKDDKNDDFMCFENDSGYGVEKNELLRLVSVSTDSECNEYYNFVSNKRVGLVSVLSGMEGKKPTVNMIQSLKLIGHIDSLSQKYLRLLYESK